MTASNERAMYSAMVTPSRIRSDRVAARLGTWSSATARSCHGAYSSSSRPKRIRSVSPPAVTVTSTIQ